MEKMEPIWVEGIKFWWGRGNEYVLNLFLWYDEMFLNWRSPDVDKSCVVTIAARSNLAGQRIVKEGGEDRVGTIVFPICLWDEGEKAWRAVPLEGWKHPYIFFTTPLKSAEISDFLLTSHLD